MRSTCSVLRGCWRSPARSRAMGAALFAASTVSTPVIAQTPFWQTIFDKTNPGGPGLPLPCEEDDGDLGFDVCDLTGGGTGAASGYINKFENFLHPEFGSVLLASTRSLSSFDPTRFCLGDIVTSTPLGRSYGTGLVFWREDPVTEIQSWEEFTVPIWDESCEPSYSTTAYPVSVYTMAVHEADGLIYAVGVLAGGNPLTHPDLQRSTTSDCIGGTVFSEFRGLIRWTGDQWEAVAPVPDGVTCMISYNNELHMAGKNIWSPIEGPHTLRWSAENGISSHGVPDAIAELAVYDLCGFSSSGGGPRVFAACDASHIGNEMRILRMDLSSNPTNDEWEEEVVSEFIDGATYQLEVLEVAAAAPRLVIAGAAVELEGDNCATTVHFRAQNTATYTPVSANALLGVPTAMVVSGGPDAQVASILIGGADLTIYDDQCEQDVFAGLGLVSIAIPFDSTGEEHWVAFLERFAQRNEEPSPLDTEAILAICYFRPECPLRTRLAASGGFTAIWSPGNQVDESPWAATVCVSNRLYDDRCSADFNQDGFTDFFDFDEYVLCYELLKCPPCTTADFNRDGFVDFFDYSDYVAAFEGDCPTP
jgi:hypothetical protein